MERVQFLLMRVQDLPAFGAIQKHRFYDVFYFECCKTRTAILAVVCRSYQVFAAEFFTPDVERCVGAGADAHQLGFVCVYLSFV